MNSELYGHKATRIAKIISHPFHKEQIGCCKDDYAKVINMAIIRLAHGLNMSLSWFRTVRRFLKASEKNHKGLAK